MNNKINIDALNNHLFEAIEMLKNNSDPAASENEKMDIETAKTIAELAKVAVEGFKTKANVLNILSKSMNPESVKQQMGFAGMLEQNNSKPEPS